MRTKPELFEKDVVKGKDFWHVYNSIPLKPNENINNMKFKVVVGNPPYQEEGISTRKAPIYHLFYDSAFNLSKKVSLITPGRFLFKAGQTPHEWMDRILSDKHFKVVKYFQKSTDIFPSVDIKGGVAYTYRDEDKDFGEVGFFSPYELLISIFNKVSENKDFVPGAFSNMVSSQGIYKFTEKTLELFPEIEKVQGKGTALKITSNSFEQLTKIFTEDKIDEDSIQILGRSSNRRIYKWVKRSYIQPCEYCDFYNVFVTEANGTGAIGEALSTPIIGTPMTGHTDTFISVGKFSSLSEAEACLKYIKTKFARTMLGTLKATQHNPRDTWANIPVQNFTEISDIDWSKTTSDIDKQLYAKYHLEEDEIDFIESMIKPME